MRSLTEHSPHLCVINGCPIKKRRLFLGIVFSGIIFLESVFVDAVFLAAIFFRHIFQGDDALILMIPIFVLANLHFLLSALMLLSHSNEKNHIHRYF